MSPGRAVRSGHPVGVLANLGEDPDQIGLARSVFGGIFDVPVLDLYLIVNFNVP